MSRVLYVFLFIFVSICSAENDENNWWKNNVRLHQDLLVKNNYDKDVNPQPAHNHSTNVYVMMHVRALYLDDVTQILTLNAWMVLYWNDLRLQWDHKDYGSLSVSDFGQSEVWKPDLMVYNSAEPTNLQHFGRVPVMVHSDGSALWVPPMTTRTECAMDLTYWPFDTQHCTINMGSWTSHGFQIDFLPFVQNSSTEYFLATQIKTSHHWTVNNARLYRNVTMYDCCPEPYITLIFDITMTRNSPIFTSTVTVPAIAIALLTLVQFVLPVDYPPRVTVGVFAALFSLIMLVNLAATLPPLGDSCPLIVKYYGMTLFLTVLSVSLSGVLARLAKEQPEVLSVPPPTFIKSLLTGPLATVLCVRSIADKVGRSGGNMGDNEEEILGESSKGYQHEWLLVAAAVDRLVMWTYVAIFVLGLIVFTSKLH